MTATQLAYLAGILDGEGDLGIAHYARRDTQKRIRNYGLKATVRISQARRGLLDTIAEWAGPENVWIGHTGKGGAYWALRFHHDCLRTLLPQVLPYFVLKRRQAEIVLTFLHFPKYVGRNGRSKREWRHRMKLYRECRFLNMSPQKRAKQRSGQLR